jgi:hypothetical protein
MEFDVKNVKSSETQSIDSFNGYSKSDRQTKETQKKLKGKGFFSQSVTSLINNVKKSFDSTATETKNKKNKLNKSNFNDQQKNFYLQDSDVATDSLDESNSPIINKISTKKNNLKAKILKNRKNYANKKNNNKVSNP